MINTIPVFSPQDASLFLKYFTGVAHVLARRFALGFHPDEEHLTSLLCELLDDRGSVLHGLDYAVADLNRDLQELGSLLQAAICLETTSYTKHEEHHYTQADFGIVLEYTDHVDRANSFRKGILVQAKKLFPSSGSAYDLGSQYSSFGADQHERLAQLGQYYVKKARGLDGDEDERERSMRRGHHEFDCDSAIQYLLYNPPFSALPANEQEYVLHRQLARETKNIYDYTHGLCLYDVLKQPDGLKATLELSALFAEIGTVHSLAEKAASSGRGKAKLAPFELRALMDAVDIRQRSFAWFLVFSFLCGGAGCQLPEFLKLVSGSQPGMAGEFGVRVPRFALRVRVTAGTNPEHQNTNFQQ